LRTDALWSDPAATLQEVQSFLEIPLVRNAEQRRVVPFESDKSVPLAPEVADYLAALYADDIRRTQSLTGLNLQGWLDPASGYDEPMRAVTKMSKDVYVRVN